MEGVSMTGGMKQARDCLEFVELVHICIIRCTAI